MTQTVPEPAHIDPVRYLKALRKMTAVESRNAEAAHRDAVTLTATVRRLRAEWQADPTDVHAVRCEWAEQFAAEADRRSRAAAGWAQLAADIYDSARASLADDAG